MKPEPQDVVNYSTFDTNGASVFKLAPGTNVMARFNLFDLPKRDGTKDWGQRFAQKFDVGVVLEDGRFLPTVKFPGGISDVREEEVYVLDKRDTMSVIDALRTAARGDMKAFISMYCQMSEKEAQRIRYWAIRLHKDGGL